MLVLPWPQVTYYLISARWRYISPDQKEFLHGISERTSLSVKTHICIEMFTSSLLALKLVYLPRIALTQILLLLQSLNTTTNQQQILEKHSMTSKNHNASDCNKLNYFSRKKIPAFSKV